MKKFLIRISIYLSVLAAITVAVNALYFIVDPEYHSMNIPDNIQICNFGSSHGQCAFNYEDFKGKYICSNFAMSAQTLEYDYRVFQHYKDKLQPGAVVFINTSYNTLLGKPEIKGKSFFTKNKRYYKFLPSSLIMQYDLLTDIYVNYFPCLSPTALTVLVKHMFNLDRTATIFDTFEIDRKQWNKTVTSRDIELDTPKAFVRTFAGRKRRQESFDTMYIMIDLCRQIGARPILVTVPFVHNYTDLIRERDPEFFEYFSSVIEEICRKTGAEYYNYALDERFRRDYSLFKDGDHMNMEGARRFTNTLLREVLGIDAEAP